MTVGETSKNLPWVEKYRPSKLEDLVSHDEIVRTINQFMQENQMPHLLFYGPPGTGKTSTILACARQMYTPQQFNSMVLELNASDDRGIGIVRGQILSFASTRTIFKAGPKLIILDEADAMTNDAQNALRRNSEDEEVQFRTVKITVIGEPATGKTSLCMRYLGCGGSAGAGGTQGAEVMAGQCLGLRPPVPLQICDVGGKALATTMLANYLYASDIVLFVYDVTNLQSFEKLRTWFTTVKEIFEAEVKKPILALFGNKSDLEHQRAVRLSVVQKFASEHLLENFKGSARTGDMVNTAFTNLVARVLGVKVRRLPETTNGRSPMPRDPDLNGHVALEPTQNLIMNRKALRRMQWKASSVKMSEDGLKALLTLSGGDMRKVLNTLQSTWLAYRDVTEDNVYTCVGHPLRSDINNILNWLMNENDFAACFKNIQDLKIIKGLALSDILTEVHSMIQRAWLPPEVLISLLVKMSDAEARLASGCGERVELAALIAAFQDAREHVSVQDSS